MSADLHFMKSVFNNDKIKQMNTQGDQLKLLEYDFETIKMNIENCATRDKVQQIEESLNDYAHKETVADIRDDVQNKANKEDIDIITS